MTKVLGIKFRQTGKIYYFDPGELDVTGHKFAIVETARGLEYGEIAGPVKEVSENEIVAPKDGTVASIDVNKGDTVESGTVLATLD